MNQFSVMTLFDHSLKRIIIAASILGLMTVYYYIPFKFEYIGNTHKIWAHRVNSIERLEYTKTQYRGVELDIVFDTATNTFDVNHPPAASIGLTLESYLSHLDLSQPIGIWLDFKNLTKENKNTALERLSFLTKKYSLKNSHIIVESPCPELLSPFNNAGFQTSYYLPNDLNKMPDEKLVKIILEINKNINLFPTSGISTNLNDYDIIAEHFPKYQKYLWSSKKTYALKLFSNSLLTWKALHDENVTVLLVKVNRQKGKR